mgnify:CR=1 FL=1
MNCTVKGCLGEYEIRRVTQTYNIEGELVVISGIPAEVCTICGDTLIDPETATLIEKRLGNLGEADETAPVFHLTAQ